MAANLTFGGDEFFRAQPDRLFAVLTDLESLARNIPDLTTSERVDARTLRCVVRPGFGFLRGTLNLTIVLAELVPPQKAAMQIDSQGIGQSIRVASQIEIAPHEGGSHLAWKAEVTELRGLVATVSPALIRGAADQLIRHAWSNLRRELGEETHPL